MANIINILKDKLLGNKTIKNGLLFSVYSFFSRGVSFVLLILLANYISPAEYGELSLFNTVVMFMGYFVGLSTSGYLSVAFFKESPAEFKQNFSAICFITLICSTIIALIVTVLNGYLVGLLKLSLPFIYIGVIISFANTFVQLNLDYLRVQEKVSWYGVLSCAFALLNFVLSLYLVISEGHNWKGRVYAQLGCDIIFGVIAIAYFLKNKLFVFSAGWNVYKKIMLWGIPLIPHLATGWLKQGCDRYIIDYYHNIADVGTFSFALNLVNIIIMVGFAFNQTNSVNLFQTLSAKKKINEKIHSLRVLERKLVILYLAMTVVIIVIVGIALPLILPKYIASLPFFLILSGYGFGKCIYNLACNYLFYFNKTKQLMSMTFITAILHLGLSLWLTRYSLYYTCVIYVISQTALCALVIWRSRKIIKEYQLQQAEIEG